VPNIYKRKYQLKSRVGGENALQPTTTEALPTITGEELQLFVMDAKSGSQLYNAIEGLGLVSEETGEPLRKPTEEERYRVQEQLRAVAAKAFRGGGSFTPEQAADAIATATRSDLEKAKQALYLIKFWSLLPIGVNIVNLK
jgi:hypothetical protein